LPHAELPPDATAHAVDRWRPRTGPALQQSVAVGATPFVGRGDELEWARARLAAAAATEPSVVLISGDAGIGKTALARQIAINAIEGGFFAAAGHAVESASDVGLGPVRGVLRELGRARRFRAAVDTARSAIALRTDRPARSSGGSDRLDQLGVFEVLLDTFVELAGDTPLLLTVEDVQWADRTSVEFLHHLARNLRDARVVVLATVRTDLDRLAGLHQATLVEMQRLAPVHRRHLARLDDTEIRSLARLVTRRHFSEQAIARLLDASGGNPLLVIELLRVDPAQWDHMTGTVDDIVRGAFDGLSARTNATLAVASLTPLAVDAELVARVSQQDLDVVEGDLRDAHTAGILESASGAVRFRHALLADAARRDLLPSQLARLHGRVADSLAEWRGAEPGELAHHLERAGRDVEAIALSIEAARAMAGAFGSVDAVPHYERTMRLLDRVGERGSPAGTTRFDLALEGLECAFYVGDTAAARRATSAAMSLSAPERDHDAWITLLCRASELAWQEGDTEESLRLLADAEGALRAGTGGSARAHVVERRSFHASMAGDGTGSLRLASSAFDLARAAGDLELEIEAQLRVGLAQSMAGNFEIGIATLRDARDRAAAAGHHRSVIRATINLTALHVGAGELATACDEAAAGAALAETLEAPRSWQTHAVAWRVVALVGAGDLVAAARLLDDSTSPPAAAFSAVLDVAGAELAWAAGDLGEARSLIDRVSLAPQDHLGWWLRSELVRRSVCVAEGDLAAAAADIDFTLDLAEFWPDALLLRLCAVAIDATTRDDTGIQEPGRLDALLARAAARADRLRHQGRPIDAEAWWQLVCAGHAVSTGRPSAGYSLAAADAFALCGRPIDEGWALVAACSANDRLSRSDIALRLDARLRRPPSDLADAIAALAAPAHVGPEPGSRTPGQATIAFGDYEVDPDRFELRRRGEVVAAEPQVLELILFFARHPQELLLKERLLDEIWGDRFVSESALTTRVKTARQLLGDDGSRQAVIKTVHRRGYRFVADLRP